MGRAPGRRQSGRGELEVADTQLRPDSKGKVRDIYDCGEYLLLVASDRVSAFDYILPDEIPHKGEILTRISAFWFRRFADLMPNHMVSIDVADLPKEFAPYADYLDGRSMLVKKAKTIPIECIVRGYLTGSGKKTYDADGTVCGIKLPAGLVEASKLPEPIFTPSTKAAVGDHDENISFERCAELVGDETATTIRDMSLALYKAAADYAATRGIIIADTKFEFGVIDGKVTLIDECLTPDSSRFWPADGYEPGHVQPSYDKQFVRDWLKANWDMTGEPPHLPAEVIEGTSKRYQEAYEILCGEPFRPMKESHVL
jgi:phosphoribosylaminoimidazole-succinocarboxamide synthase